MKKIIKRIIFSFGKIIYNFTDSDFILKFIHLEIGRNSKIKKNIIKGNVSIGNNTLLTDNRIFGKIKIEDNVVITKSEIIRDFTVLKNSILKQSIFQGKIYLGINSKVTNSKIIDNIKIGNNSIIEGANFSGNIDAGDFFKVYNNGVTLYGNITIGKYTTLNGPNTDIYTSINKVKIGNFCSIARNVSFQEYNHKIDRVSSYHMSSNVFEESRLDDIYSKGDIVLENDVWIGTHCVILSGAYISTGAVVAANSVISGFVPPYSIVAGSPAKVIKYRFSENQIKSLLASEWWNWDDEKLKRNKLFLTNNDIDFNLISN